MVINQLASDLTSVTVRNENQDWFDILGIGVHRGKSAPITRISCALKVPEANIYGHFVGKACPPCSSWPIEAGGLSSRSVEAVDI